MTVLRELSIPPLLPMVSGPNHLAENKVSPPAVQAVNGARAAPPTYSAPAFGLTPSFEREASYAAFSSRSPCPLSPATPGSCRRMGCRAKLLVCCAGPALGRAEKILAGLRRHMEVRVITDADLVAADLEDTAETLPPGPPETAVVMGDACDAAPEAARDPATSSSDAVEGDGDIEVFSDAGAECATPDHRPAAPPSAAMFSRQDSRESPASLFKTFKDSDAVLVLGSQFFWGLYKHLERLCKHAAQNGANMLNDVESLKRMQDRSWVHRKLQEHQVPTPAFVECVRSNILKPVLEEHMDYIVVNGTRINKPFVEKPADRRDREIYVYFPQEQGGGRCLLSTRESGDVEYCSRFDPVGCVRREGSFIYQEYLQSEGFTVQTICVGGSAFGNACPSGLLTLAGDGIGGKKSAEPYTVWLLPEERTIALKLNAILKQSLFGITFVRSQTANPGASGASSAISYVIDVWPGVPSSGIGAHRADVVRSLRTVIDSRMPGPLKRAMSWTPTQAASLADSDSSPTSSRRSDRAIINEVMPADRLLIASTSPLKNVFSDRSFDRYDKVDEAQSQVAALEPDIPADAQAQQLAAKREAEETAEDRLCLILVARHGERSPKQKLKAKVKMESMLGVGWLFGFLASTRADAKTAVKHPSMLELRALDQLSRLESVARELLESGHDVSTMVDALGYVARAKLACHAKISCSTASSSLATAQMEMALKWGGELTPDGETTGESLGACFRKEHYPHENFYHLHASLRHDIKVYSSNEPRCTQTAAAFIRGFLRLHSPLPPIIAALVRTEDFDFLNPDPQPTHKRPSEVLEESANLEPNCTKVEVTPVDAEIDRYMNAPWQDVESIIDASLISAELREFASLGDALRALRSHMGNLCKVLAKDFNGPLYEGETPALLRSRYKNLLGDLGKKEGNNDRQIMDKAPHTLDNLEYDQIHNFSSFPDAAQCALNVVLPLARAICDLTVPLEVVLPPKDEDGGDAGEDKVRKLLHKLRWDLRVASGQELGTEKEHLKKHSALHVPSAQMTCCNDSPKEPCVRTRMYFSHNSRLLALLSVLLGGVVESRCDDEEPPRFVPRLGFLSHVVLQLWRRRSDGSLHVSCEYARSGSDTRQKLFRIPFSGFDSLLTAALQRQDADSCASQDGR